MFCLATLRSTLTVAFLGVAMLSFASAAPLQVPSFSMEDLRAGTIPLEFLESLQTTGLISIKFPQTYEDTRGFALSGLCSCLENLEGADGFDSITLGDGATSRSTLATATVGQMPLPLADREKLEGHCGAGTVAAMETLRDQVAHVSDMFVKTIDHLRIDSARPSPLLHDKYGGSFSNLNSIIQSANHLEHFHMYSKNGSSESISGDEASLSLKWHTDAGLFLSFVPAWNCNNAGQSDSSFWVQLPNGDRVPAIFEPGSVVIMLGVGAEHWLNESSLKLKATRHAVQMDSDSARSWYGMMFLVPESAVIQESPIPQTFGEMKENMRLVAGRQPEYGISNPLHAQGVAIGCGPALDSATLKYDRAVDDSESSMMFPLSARRRVQHVQDASACNNATNFFCWMQCLEIPNFEQAESYVDEGYSLYCLDPGILARTGNQVSKAVEPCLGEVHNSNCQGVWHVSSPLVPGQSVKFNSTISDDDLQYCYGGTSMYMDGFHWIHDTTCVIYLFPGWVLSSQGRFAAACIGTLLFGIMVEFVISRRRHSMTQMGPGFSRLLSSACFYGLQLSMGYLIMLVVMTYSIPLFLSCVFGLVGGHVIFNAKDALVNRTWNSDEKDTHQESQSAEGSKSNDEETAQLGDRPQNEISTSLPECCCMPPEDKSSNIIEAEIVDHGVPEGSTPCCQNVL